MKKILFILIFCFLFLNVHSFEGKVVKEKFKVKSLTVDLPSNGGEWKLIRYRGKKVYNAFFNSYFLAEFKNGIISEFVEIFEGKGEPDYPMLTSQFFYNLLYNANKIRGCQERLEYYIFELYKTGNVGNCFIIRNWDPYKEIFDPTILHTDYTDMNYVPKIYQKYITKNNLDLPKMMLRSESYYFDNFDVGRIYIVYRMINPEVNGAPTTKYKTETLSEYFVNNLNKYPKHKKFLENWSKLQSIRHKEFEKKLKVKKSSKLDLDKYIGDGNVKKMENKNLNVKKKKEKNQEIIELEQLYEEGIITKEELEKAKELVN